MFIVAAIYGALVWLVFFKLKLVRLDWLTGGLAAAGGLIILALFLALLNTLTPSGRFVVAGRVVEVTPNVSGHVVAVAAKPNMLMKAGDTLFQIDPAPFQSKVRQLEASLADARQRAAQLDTSYQQATATVDGLVAQREFNTRRLADLQKLSRSQASSEFREQEAQVQLDLVTSQLQAAKAAQANAKLARDAEVGGENPLVAQMKAQLDNAKWELDQTTVRAPSEGYATSITITVGQRATALRSAMPFLPRDEVVIIGLFAPSGFGAIKSGAEVTLVFFDRPGRRYSAKVLDIPVGTGQGQITVSGTIARAQSIGGTSEYPATISMPDGLTREDLRVGMPGAATVYASNSGPIGVIASVLMWVSSYMAYF